MVRGDQISIQYEGSRTSRTIYSYSVDPMSNILGLDAMFSVQCCPFPIVCMKMQELVGTYKSLTSQWECVSKMD